MAKRIVPSRSRLVGAASQLNVSPPPPRNERRAAGMSTGPGIDYSAWDHIYVSDDEDVTNPYVDTPSLFRMRHRARLERTAGFQQRGEDLECNVSECRRRLGEAEGRLAELEDGRGDEDEDEDGGGELRKVRAQVKTLKKDLKSFEKMIEEYRREARKQPWDVDSISKEGFSKSVFNMTPAAEKETREKDKTFVEKYAKEIQHFGFLRRWDDSQKYLSDNPHLVCEETANRLVLLCIDFEIDEKHGVMEQVAHQAIVMQFILDLARALEVDARGCFRRFFSKLKAAEAPYLDAFHRELELLKGRIRDCARSRKEEEEEAAAAAKETREEERRGRLGPGGLDPVEVYESLPKEMQKSFDEKNIPMLQEAISKMHMEEGKYYLQRCIDSGLWVPDSVGGGGGDGDDDDYDDDDEDSNNS